MSTIDAANPPPMMSCHLTLPGHRRGKVREVYSLPPGDRLLLVATDRISAFDVVMPTPIPGKGVLLTRLSSFWLRAVEGARICRSHLISGDSRDIPDGAFGSSTSRADLDGRSTIAHAARIVPIECVVRGYLEGSGWKEYQATGSVCGVKLPQGLSQCDRLPEPIFTPATKEEAGAHDENIDFDTACARVGRPVMERLKDLSLAIYRFAADHALARGIIIADTKFEFGFAARGGLDLDELMICDEVLTPDSSRFWPASSWAPGKAQASFDKQYLREYLERLVSSGQWHKQPPGPPLPAEVVDATIGKYREACDRLMG